MEDIDIGFTSGSLPQPDPTSPDADLAFTKFLDNLLVEDYCLFNSHDLDNSSSSPWSQSYSNKFSNDGKDVAIADETLHGPNQDSKLDLSFGLSNPVDGFNVGFGPPWPLDDTSIWHETSVTCQPENEQGFLPVPDEDNLLSTPQSTEKAAATARKVQQPRQTAALPTPPEYSSSPPSVRRQPREKKHACPETNCRKLFPYPKDVQRHYVCVHENKRPLLCPHDACKYHWRGFNRKDALERHMRVHSGGKKRSR